MKVTLCSHCISAGGTGFQFLPLLTMSTLLQVVFSRLLHCKCYSYSVGVFGSILWEALGENILLFIKLSICFYQRELTVFYFSQWVIIYYNSLFGCSSCHRLSHWHPFQAGLCVLLIGAHHFLKSISLCFWHQKMFQAHLTTTPPQPWNQRFLHHSWFLLAKHGI